MKNILKKSLISFFSLWGSVMILLFVIVFSSCSTTKKVEKAKVNESVATTVDSKTDQSKNESLKVTDKTEKVTDKSLVQIENETNASSINTGDRNHGKLWLVISFVNHLSRRLQ